MGLADLEELSKKIESIEVKNDYREISQIIKENLPLDKDGGITWSFVFENPQLTKDQLYVIVNYWYADQFSGKGILLNEKEVGTIIAQEDLNDISHNNAMGTFQYFISISPTIKTDIKNGKIRVTLSVNDYDVYIKAHTKWGRDSNEKWLIPETFPYNEKGKEKKVTGKALFETHKYLTGIALSLCKAVESGVSGNEADDDW